METPLTRTQSLAAQRRLTSQRNTLVAWGVVALGAVVIWMSYRDMARAGKVPAVPGMNQELLVTVADVQAVRDEAERLERDALTWERHVAYNELTEGWPWKRRQDIWHHKVEAETFLSSVRGACQSARDAILHDEQTQARRHVVRAKEALRKARRHAGLWKELKPH